MKNYYEILEISSSATIGEIKKAYRLKAVKYHPDKHFGDKYFVDKFLEIKIAYDVLSNTEKRIKYDIELNEYLNSKKIENTSDNNKETSINEEEFLYNPHKPFYSINDRLDDITPQFYPIVDHWGQKLPDNIDFFILPKKIGKLVSGYSTLTKDKQPSESFFGKIFNKFNHTCSFMGVNGFAIFQIKGQRDNIIQSFELNFKNVTDLLVVSEQRKLNFNYQNTAYGFEWSSKGKIIKDFTGVHYSQENDPEHDAWFEFWLNKWAERYWTIYLLDNMEKDLDTKGFIEFRIIDKQGLKPFIKLGVGYITFLTIKEEITYNFNEISKIYIKGSKLFIEHKNYEKKYLLFSKGNKNGVDLLHMTNRNYFVKSLEILLGYSFEH